MNSKVLFAITAASLVACSVDPSASEPSPMAQSVAPPEPAASATDTPSENAPASPASPANPAEPAPSGEPTPAPAKPVTFYSIDADNLLVRFSTDDLSKPTSIAITGLAAGETISTIEVDSSDGTLWAIGSTNRTYVIDPTTGQATKKLDGQFFIPLTGTRFELDYNANVKMFRIVGDDGQNVRISPTTGNTVWPVDKKLAFAVGDANEGKAPAVAGLAYRKTQDALFGVDPELDVLVQHTQPNNGVIATIGALGVDVTGALGFEIVEQNGADVAYLLARTPLAKESNLYTVDLATGKATLVGAIAGPSLHGLTQPL
jgi:outer membrane protein assembly factor BamB